METISLVCGSGQPIRCDQVGRELRVRLWRVKFIACGVVIWALSPLTTFRSPPPAENGGLT